MVHETYFGEDNCCVLVDHSLSKVCDLTAKRERRNVICVRCFQSKQGILMPLHKVMVTCHLEKCGQPWSLMFWKSNENK